MHITLMHVPPPCHAATRLSRRWVVVISHNDIISVYSSVPVHVYMDVPPVSLGVQYVVRVIEDESPLLDDQYLLE